MRPVLKQLVPFLLITLLAFLIFSCKKENTESPQFRLLRKDATGLDFQNKLIQTPEFNPLNYMYFFNGGGVALGDFNNDGLADLYFTSNMGENKLFLNLGNLKFRDITEAAGIGGCQTTLGDAATNCGWSGGASVVDINNDGLLDIYVSKVGDFQSIKGRNQLFICKGIQDGIPVYEDEAIPYGLDLVGFGTQAAFFDYDLDGDLDMFQLNHSVHANGTFGQKKSFQGTVHPLSGDKLLRNDGGKFTNVSQAAGINSTVIGYGLGIVTGDVNFDGWPDIYIGNDFHENDYLYINQHDGTFREVLAEQIRHTSQFSMGVDMADLNNDGWGEIISLDMMPEDPYILKSSLGEDNYGIYHFKLTYGYQNQYARNTLQKNNCDGTFSEIGMFAGVHATDWSWASLFLDFDNDGLKDMFISNGIERRMNDIDYAKFRETNPIRFKAETNNLEDNDLQFVEKMPRVKLPNKFFRNAGQFRFEDLEKQIKNSANSFSNGAVYADLDNDGDLDVVVNNLEDEPFLYENLENERQSSGHAYLAFELTGPQANRQAIGARALVVKGAERLVYEHFPVRGYQSSALSRLHVGIGNSGTVDSIFLIWPDNTYQTLAKPVQYNQVLKLSWKPGLPVFDYGNWRKPPEAPFQFEDLTARSGLNFYHKENEFVEFNRELLIPFMVSTEGPAVAVGDVNGDGLEDVFFGSAKREKSALFLQKKGGVFYENTPAIIRNDSLFEDVDAVFVDIDNDGDLDLVVAAGGNEFWDKHEALKQRVYINDGKGNFNRHEFDGLYMTASCVLPADFNGDGLVDLFFGARALPWHYGLTPHSALLLNKGNGNFENIGLKAGLRDIGLVKNGAWADMDADGDPDLVLAVEWEPVTIFLNNGSTFEKKPINDLRGWWNFALPYDFDGDGDLDILAGNLGENAKFKPSDQEPVRMYVDDFDGNNQIEQVLTYYVKGKEVPFATYEEIMKTLPELKKKFLFSKDFAKATVPEIFGKEKLAKATIRSVNALQSMYFENTGNGFKAHPLPDALQFSPMMAALAADLNGNSRAEVLLGGNFYESTIEMGRYDAFYGGLLRLDPKAGLRSFPLGKLRIDGQVRRIRSINVAGRQCFILARNNDSALLIAAEREPG